MDKRSSRRGMSIFKRIYCSVDRNRLGELLVLRGLISPKQLRHALLQQKDTQQPLGQIFVSEKLISRKQLFFILGGQSVLRTVTGFLICVFLLTNPTKKAHADGIRDVPAKLSLVSEFNNVNFSKMSAYPALFGSDEKRSQNLTPFTKWTSMFKRFEDELSKSGNQSVIANWQEELSEMRRLDLKTMADRVNRMMNEKRYIVDDRNWGKSDYWATPIEFLKRGGDCEDFAIAKYAALRMLGVPEERLRVAIVHDNVKNIPHAILIVYTDNGAYYLDNQNTQIVQARELKRYRPIFSINRQAWWLHTAPRSTVLASAR